MATVHFTGTRYVSTDGAAFINFVEPGYYQVSEEKAAQVVTDFPSEFSLVQEGTVSTPVSIGEPKAKLDEATQVDQSAEEITFQETPTAEPATEDLEEVQKPAKKGK